MVIEKVILDTSDVSQIDFTGQHRNIINNVGK